ncbi:MAG: 30S ribosomal protein S30e [Candidatus Brockarchaeota archaeon]|nr:30S ribosomal protein S30e [Candidatus Brockarchaeota archaeon]MBO3808429.1 30S ribosomal protein S30e [Candidatus Brockarchaeota archaeon]MBO3832878.1 30S ribosomal protein S30e [Candidatus Brockarchaeota archaeon]MBO3841715.1 30S ribosomal protein S30e [Candidatus Brockarchaeota archaeon]
MTLAGKVRSLTPRVAARERPPDMPRRRVRSIYRKRVVLNRQPGQIWKQMRV